jgi:hypothetical protein
VRNRIFFFAFAAFLSSAAASTSGCASKPTMHLNHAEVSGIQVAIPAGLSVVLTCVVDVYNPNGYDVAIRAMRGTTVIGGRYPIPVDFHAPGDGVWLASNATTQVRVPIAIPVPTAIAIVRDAYLGPLLDYQLNGKADVTASRTFQLEKDDYSVNEHGTITREQIAQSLTGVRY